MTTPSAARMYVADRLVFFAAAQKPGERARRRVGEICRFRDERYRLTLFIHDVKREK